MAMARQTANQRFSQAMDAHHDSEAWPFMKLLVCESAVGARHNAPLQMRRAQASTIGGKIPLGSDSSFIISGVSSGDGRIKSKVAHGFLRVEFRGVERHHLRQAFLDMRE